MKMKYVKIYTGDKMKSQVKTITVKVSENTMEKMNEYFADKKNEKTPPYAVFQGKDADTTVTLYQSGKAVFQGISADIDANIWSETEKHLNPNKKIEIKTASNNKNKKIAKNSHIYYSNSIGSDEVGTGDYFGPIVVSASYVSKENIPFLESLKVRDSKKMTDETILKIVPEIIKKIPYSSMILNNEEYNQECQKNINLNAMKAILHNKVLLNLTSTINNYDYVVVDQFAEAKTYYKYLINASKVQKNITFITKAEDQCLAVACGALISRYIFLKEIDKISKEYDIIIPKGAGPLVDEVGATLIKKHGIQVLNKIAKINFKNTEKIKKLAES